MQKYPQNKAAGNTTARPVKTEGYCSDILHAKRDRKRREAQERQREHDALTLDQRLFLCCHERRGSSGREAARIAKLMISKA